MQKLILLLTLFGLPSLRAEVQLLHSFEFGLQYPQSKLVQAADGNFYGTALNGGLSATAGGAGVGGIFRVTPAGVISNLASFFGTNGANPAAGLTLGADGLLYGTTQAGGANNLGTVFSVSTSGGIKVLYSFDGTHGSTPQTAVTAGGDGNFYGTTLNGGANNDGTIFQVTPGGALTTLFSFGATNPSPGSALCLAPDGNFYGTTQYGPANGSGGIYYYGTIYRITPAGVFTQLVGLTNTQGTVSSPYPDFRLTTVSNVMYGVFYGGGTNGGGCFYSLTTNGVFSPVLHFSHPAGGAPVGGPTWSPDGNFYCIGRAGGLGNGVLIKISPPNAMTSAWTGQIAATFDSAGNGSSPSGGMTLASDGNFYGVTGGGGDTGWGEFYRFAGAGGGLSGLASFNNFGGISPRVALTLAPDGNFYGTTYAGGPGDNGTLFRITTNGIFTRLATFSGTNGYDSLTPLCLGPDGALYGANFYGGANLGGTLFSLTTNGNFRTVYSFASASSGAWPQGGLAVGPDHQIYGTTSTGGTNAHGTVFRYNTNGTLATVFSFAGTNGDKPLGGLFWNDDNYCYGTTYLGGSNNVGTIFRFDTNGNYNTVATFVSTNGYNPVAGLVAGADGNLYGTAYGNSYLYRIQPGSNSVITVVNNAAQVSGSVEYAGFTPGADQKLYTVTFNGGAFNNGSLLCMDTNGVIAVVSTLSSALGIAPYPAPVFGPDGNLYGTTSAGGPGNGGTIYRYVFDKITNVQRTGSNAIITASGTTGGNYALFATTNLAGGVWTNIAATVATNYSVTLKDPNAWKYPQRFYRTAAQ